MKGAMFLKSLSLALVLSASLTPVKTVDTTTMVMSTPAMNITVFGPNMTASSIPSLSLTPTSFSSTIPTLSPFTLVPSSTPSSTPVTPSTPTPSTDPSASIHARVALGVGLTMFLLAITILAALPLGFYLYRRFSRIKGHRPYESLHDDL
ncbi:G8 domain-containing protein DDB_G0286311-like [Halichondria panicea]|uniref:G8 domain-containing protein DDB_G0286311-like n=1 Tax=Halichondria panicea TaxID=6063 RepID=UPI00312B33AD